MDFSKKYDISVYLTEEQLNKRIAEIVCGVTSALLPDLYPIMACTSDSWAISHSPALCCAGILSPVNTCFSFYAKRAWGTECHGRAKKHKAFGRWLICHTLYTRF